MVRAGARAWSVVVWWQDPASIGAGQLDDGAAVGRFEHVAVERILGIADRDLAPVDTEDRVPAPRLLEVVGRDHDPAPLPRQRRDQLFERLGRGPVKARERLV